MVEVGGGVGGSFVGDIDVGDLLVGEVEEVFCVVILVKFGLVVGVCICGCLVMVLW